MRYDKIPASADVALPGRSDLDIDLSGITVVTCLVDPDGTILVGLEGGSGSFVSTDDVLVDVASRDGAPVIGEVVMAFSDGDTALTSEIVRTLERWRDRSTPVRMCGGPGLVTLLIAGREDWPLAPRRAFPN